MDLERTIETQRHRLLCIIAGLIVTVGFLAVGPVSRGFSAWTLAFVGSILSRAEAASRYLLMTQAYLMVARSGLDVNRDQIAASIDPGLVVDEAEISLSDCRRRLKALRALLMDLPRYALRLLHRIAKLKRRTGDQCSPCFDICWSTQYHRWHLAAIRIERPPDKDADASSLIPLPRNLGGR